MVFCPRRIGPKFLCLLFLASSGLAGDQQAWPYFRTAGRSISANAPALPGENLANGSVAFTLTNATGSFALESADGSALVRASVVRSRGTHYVIAWGDKLVYYQPYIYADGNHLSWDIRTRSGSKVLDAQVWATNPPVRIRLTGAAEGARFYPYAFFGEEAVNAMQLSKGEPLTPLSPAVVQCAYRMTAGEMNVVACALADFGALDRATIRFGMPGGAKPAEAVAKVEADGSVIAALPVGELPAGQYPCVVSWLDKTGAIRLTATQQFERVALPWLHNRLGMTDKVYAPFEPVKVDGDRVSCVLKQFQVGTNGLFRSIRIKDEEILAAPIRLEMTRDGKDASFAVTDAAKPTARSEAAAGWQSRFEGAGLTVRAAVTLEFDGMARYELTLDPGVKAVRVDSLVLTIPLKAEHGGYIHALPLGGNFRDYEVTRYLSERDGMSWDSKTGFGKGALMPAVGSFAPMVWLGGMVRGLCFFADNDKGWFPSANQPAITVMREKGVVAMRLHFICEPSTIDTPRTLVFGLLATPAKPPPEDLRGWSRGDLKRYGPVAGRITSCDSFAPWNTPAREQAFDIFPMSNDWARAERAAAEMRTGAFGGKYPAGQALMLYFDKPWGRSGGDGLHFDWEWRSSGEGQRSAYVYTPSLVDCRVWYMNEYLRRNIYDGIYIDDIFPTANWNTETGTAYSLPDGRVQPGVSFFGFREFLKRTWNCFHANGKRPIVTIHTTATFVVPSFSFATSIYDGEDSQRMGNPKHDFVDVWPMERYHVLDNPERTGLATIFMFKGAYADMYGKDPETQSRVYRGVWMVGLLHDLWGGSPVFKGPYNQAVMPLRFLATRYAGTDTRFLPYWSNGRFVATTANLPVPLSAEQLPGTFWRAYWSEEYVQALARNPLRVSLYQNTNSLLVVVGNYARVPVMGRVKLDLEALGFGKSVPTFADVDDWPPLVTELPEDRVVKQADGVKLDLNTLELDKSAPTFAVVDDWPPLSTELPADGVVRQADGVIQLTVLPRSFRLLEATWRKNPAGATR